MIITYTLSEEPEGEVTLEVLDADGRLVRRLSSVIKTPYTPPEHPDWNPNTKAKPELETKAGIHRASWDLNWDEAAWPSDARFDTGTPRTGPLASPGEYTLRLTVDGRKTTQPLRVDADPRSSASVDDIEAQVAFALESRAQLARITAMVETIRGLRSQLTDRNQRLANDLAAAELVAAGEELIAGLTAIEEAIHNPHAEVDYDVLGGRHGGARLWSRVSWLFNSSSEHDGPPTQGMEEVGAELAAELARQESAFDALVSEDLARINELASELSIQYVLTPETVRQ